jgi:type I restriction enzyme M protein
VTVERPERDVAGKIVKGKNGESKADSGLRDFENIPFLRKDDNGKLVKQTIAEYIEREVKPHVSDTWIDENKTKTGYEINFTKYFYEFKPLRSLSDIKADILRLEEETLELEKMVLLKYKCVATGDTNI